MLSFAIVEDDPAEADALKEYLERFSVRTGENVKYAHFPSALEFLETYRHQYDIVFMDIQLPGMDGMTAARQLRDMDESVVLIFTTSLAQYAVEGYSVSALDYMLKPVSYPALELKLMRAMSYVEKKQAQEIVIADRGVITKVPASTVTYIEIFNHHISYHTESGSIGAYGTLKEVESSLPLEGFFRCSNNVIVNLSFVEAVEGLTATVAGKKIDISRTRRREFLTAIHRWCGIG